MMDYNEIEIRSRTINPETGHAEITAYHPSVGQVTITRSSLPMSEADEMALIAGRLQRMRDLEDSLEHP